MLQTSEAAESAAQNLLDGFLLGPQLDRQMGWSERTRSRRELEGLPVIKLGATKLYPVDKVRAWILSRAQGAFEAPRRGRPRKSAA